MKNLNISSSTISDLDSVISLEITPQLQTELETLSSKPHPRPNRVTAVHLAMVQHGFITNSHQHIIANCFTEFRMKQLSRKIM